MPNNSWEEHTAALTNTNIMLSLQRELRAVTEERDKLLAQTTNTEPHERLWIPGEEPSK